MSNDAATSLSDNTFSCLLWATHLAAEHHFGLLYGQLSFAPEAGWREALSVDILR